MAVKVEVKDADKAEKSEYPRLMRFKRSENLVVLFSGPQCGVVVSTSPSNHPIGHYAPNWVIEKFTDFNGTITLSNE